MADGKWRITRYAGNIRGAGGVTEGAPNVVEEIRVWWDPETDVEVPESNNQPHALVLVWPDGHEDHYPWCSTLKAEYHPPTKDKP